MNILNKHIVHVKKGESIVSHIYAIWWINTKIKFDQIIILIQIFIWRDKFINSFFRSWTQGSQTVFKFSGSFEPGCKFLNAWLYKSFSHQLETTDSFLVILSFQGLVNRTFNNNVHRDKNICYTWPI